MCCMPSVQPWPFCWQVVEIKPDWPKGYSRVGAAAIGAQDYDAAIAAYEKGAHALSLTIKLPGMSHGCIVMSLHSRLHSTLPSPEHEQNVGTQPYKCYIPMQVLAQYRKPRF